ncbi:unnamed protein product [Closterium sp. Naga37s-1]|nr:unnamed protein product [Closterium sp. Naga37s-1]
MSKRRQQRLHVVAIRVGQLNEDEQSTPRSPRASLGFSPLRPTKPRSNTPVSQLRSNTPTPTHVIAKGTRASAAAPANAAVVRIAPVKPAAAAAKGTPTKATRVAPGAAKSVSVKSCPVGSVAKKVAGENAREQGDERAAPMAVRAAAGKGWRQQEGEQQVWGRVQGVVAVVRVASVSQGRAGQRTRLQRLRQCRLRLTALVNRLLQQQQWLPLAFQNHG